MLAHEKISKRFWFGVCGSESECKVINEKERDKRKEAVRVSKNEKLNSVRHRFGRALACVKDNFDESLLQLHDLCFELNMEKFRIVELQYKRGLFLAGEFHFRLANLVNDWIFETWEEVIREEENSRMGDYK